MSVDVIVAAAASEAAWLTSRNNAFLATISEVNNKITNVSVNPANSNCFYLWQNIPQLRGVTCAVEASCICNTSGGNGCSPDICFLCCNITVPAGSTIARFMVWGAGAGSGGGNCCSFAPSGATGAFSSVIMPVTPGEVYCMYVGNSSTNCQYCCGCSNYIAAGAHDGMRSYIVGPGLCNFCADGGEANLWEGMKARACSAGKLDFINANCCKFVDIRNISSAEIPSYGGCICYGSTVCTGSGLRGGPYNCVNTQGSYTKRGYGCTTRGAVVWSIPSLYTGHVFDTNSYGFGLFTPTYSPVQTPQCYSYTNYSYTSDCYACAWGGSWCSGSQCSPGTGGFWTSVFGGTTAIYGDRGRGGRACIQFLSL